MVEAIDPTGVVLKILTGVQAGIDIALREGDYTLGSGDEDDIQFFDVSLKPAHARLAIRAGKMQIAGGAGQVRTRNGIVLEAGGAPVDLEPLDIVTVGTTRFALGPRVANWASITDAERDDPDGLYSAKPRKAQPAKTRRHWPVLLAIAIPLGVASVGVGFAALNAPKAPKPEEEAVRTSLAIVEEALAVFDFRARLTLTEELDKSLSLTGFVDDAAQRRGVVAAVQATGIPVRTRLTVLATIREEVASLLETENVGVEFALSPVGVLTLTGVILDPDRATSLVEMVREQVPGLASIDSQIRTAPTLLAEVEALADRAQIKPLVLLRIDGPLIEASGALPTEKIDSWAGFLQSYATQFASIIPLRSFVQLQSPGVTVEAAAEQPKAALYLGAGTGVTGDVAIDLQRLKTGSFELSDVFANEISSQLAASAEARDASPREERQGINVAGLLGLPVADDEPAPSEASSEVSRETRPEAPTDAGSEPTSDSPGGGPVIPAADVNLLGRELVTRWQQGTLGDSSAASALGEDLRTLESSSLTGPAQPLAKRYAPLLAGAVPEADAYEPCWYQSRLNQSNVTGALFWLDLLSVSRELSLADLDRPTQALILEAALSPQWTASCAAKAAGGEVQSPYLYEVSRNPSFVSYIARDIGSFPIEVAGVNTAGDRYIQTRAGLKMAEGSAPDATSRLVLVGELGAAFQRDDGYSTYVFDSSLNWRTQ
ncbi:EscD/YscD/HrpQ family type III secretion system periplasmic domain-containing protein [Devosia sp. ZB163]|uniref:FHA domain-containing protein n=1 Tax=Devosia sp. ZB163 TaxID=3025938 RepID=UPI0023626FB4|nr:EscD/YscD/HrpQ family type III secretion system periplasmic domain-containing protein [Devosia sp. ZB163]MDC9823038.1 EscD/YscD/HrpQ family type III secretion system periplasmic domain-containing protein [Devosia sp. ZB163]